MKERLQICRNCRQLYDPAIQVAADGIWAEALPCSWHPGELERLKTTGPAFNYRDAYRWTCCDKHVLSSIRLEGNSEHDVPPRRSPGCKQGRHEPDLDLTLDIALADRLRALHERLREMEERESMPNRHPRVFISYSHADGDFVDSLAHRFDADKIGYWRDEKDLLVGDVIDRTISDGIQSHALFLIVLSPRSIQSTWVGRELDEASHEAAEGKKVLLPVLVGGLTAEGLPGRLRRFKCADFNEDFERAYRSLKTAVVVHLGRLHKNAG